MRSFFTTGILLLSLSQILLAQKPVITIIPLVAGTPVTGMTLMDVKSLTKMKFELTDQTLALLKNVDINPDSCEFITAEENSRYATQIGKMDICYNYCKVQYDHGITQSSTGIYYNGFAKLLNKPKLHMLYTYSADRQIQEVSIYYYRGLPAKLMDE